MVKQYPGYLLLQARANRMFTCTQCGKQVSIIYLNMLPNPHNDADWGLCSKCIEKAVEEGTIW